MSPESAVEQARRLELADCEQRRDQVRGQVRGLTVALHGEGPFNSLSVECPGDLRIASMTFDPASPNHPDVVLTGDPAFDDAMLTLAEPRQAPTARARLEDATVRAAILRFFRARPYASIERGWVCVPIEGPQGVTTADIQAAIELARTLGGTQLAAQPPENELPDQAKADALARARSLLLGVGLLTSAGVGFLVVDRSFEWSDLPLIVIGAVVLVGVYQVVQVMLPLAGSGSDVD
jgi:hypothetical protein